MTGVVIVGAGQAGFRTAASLREHGYPGPVTLVGDEPGLPYERPPLSKGYLAGTAGPLDLRPASFYDRNGIALTHARAEHLDRQSRTVHLADGTALPYDHLVLATGARPRVPPIPGAHLAGVLTLRTRRDADTLRERLAEAEHVVVVGAGFIGLEFAAGAGRPVTVLEALRHPLSRVVSPGTAAHFTALHRRHGNALRFGRRVVAFHGDGRVRAVELADGTRLPCDLALVAVGVTPNAELARDAGLPAVDGVVVDDRLTTPDPRVSAIGDCAAFPSGGVRVRLESVQNADDQARCVAARLTGDARPYTAVPWFWSEQFGSTVQIAGLGAGHDRAVRDGGSVRLYRDGRLVCVESVDSPVEHLRARRELAGREPEWAR